MNADEAQETSPGGMPSAVLSRGHETPKATKMLAFCSPAPTISVMPRESSPSRRKFKTCRRIDELGHAHALTFTCYQNQQFLSRDRTCTWLAEAINMARTKHRFDLWAYVFMPEHVHLLLLPRREECKISKVLATIKQSVTHRALAYVRASAPAFLEKMCDQQPNGRTCHRFWQRGGGHDRNLWSEKAIVVEIDYFHANPIRRGLCLKPEDWLWSSAADYARIRQGPLTLDLASLPAIY